MAIVTLSINVVDAKVTFMQYVGMIIMKMES